MMDCEPIRFLSVCSGIEAASVAWVPLGWECVGVAEIEKFPSAVLNHHYPTVKNYGDFTNIQTAQLGHVDILCGGTPCQAFSVAGARSSLSDARGNLTLAFVDLAHELVDHNGLRNVIWENVPGVLSTHDNAFGCFLAGLVGAGEPLVPAIDKPAAGKSNRAYGWSAKHKAHYIKWPRSGVVVGPKGRAAWTVKDAQYFGLAQHRERVLLVADFGNGADPAAVLFEPESVPRHSPPSRETGEGIAPAVAPSFTASGRGVERTGDTRGQDPVVACYVPPIARCVATREGSSQDYESTTMVAAHAIQAGALRAGGHTTSHANAGVIPAVAYSVALRGRDGGTTAEVGDELAFALRASSGGGDKPHILTSAVRRLTPKECERIMGFPDDYTLIPWRGKPAAQCPDGPRYKALGNSWAVPKFRWLGERIETQRDSHDLHF